MHLKIIVIKRRKLQMAENTMFKWGSNFRFLDTIYFYILEKNLNFRQKIKITFIIKLN